jgi:2-polyprenyl-3-methyl-5-hydroxy-6-metoxy-1,4-benzoquinol methylase
MSSLNTVRDHFDRDAERFDAIYEEAKPLHQRMFDRLRHVVVERFELVRALAPIPGAWSVLDVGCGPGRYGLALAALGARRIVGLDVAGKMLDLARAEFERAGVAERGEFVHSDFLSFRTDERFEVVLAMGYFDYLEEPLPHLKKMIEVCRGRVFASIPKRWEWRAPIRKAKFLAIRSFVRFYSKSEIRGVIRDAGVSDDRCALIDLGRDWLLVVNCAKDARVDE